MKFAFITFTLASSSSPILEDDVVMLSVASQQSAGLAMQTSLIEFARAESPIQAAGFLQEFAASTVARGESVDNITKETLKMIGKNLTEHTYMMLELAHRQDQTDLDLHWEAIETCGNERDKRYKQDVDSLDVQQVRVHERDMIRCRGLPDHSNPLNSLLQMQTLPDWLYIDENGERRLKITDDVRTQVHVRGDGGGTLENGKQERRYFHHYSSHMYDDEDNFHATSLLERKDKVCKECEALADFVKSLNSADSGKPNCKPPAEEQGPEPGAPQATTSAKSYIDADLTDWFDNYRIFSKNNLETWQNLSKACSDARDAYDQQDEWCDREQTQYEGAFCAYRQGLHSTCARYQDCHILSEEDYKELITASLERANQRKIDWKAIHKIACYIKVLVSDGSAYDRNNALHNCESGDLNTLANILTGFDETNYMSLIIPEISSNVSCWDMKVKPLIDFKRCDMSSVAQYPCSADWMTRYVGLESPATCTDCAALPESLQYTPKQGAQRATMDDYGGGWIFVNEPSRNEEDINDLVAIDVGSYYLPNYNVNGLRWNEVLVQRVSYNWCDSWGRQSSKWAEQNGASMCVQSDNEHVYCINNHNSNSTDPDHQKHPDPERWRQQPVSHFGAICGEDCECWPHEVEQTVDNLKSGELQEKLCFAHSNPNATANSPVHKNVKAPHHVQIKSMEDDGSVVKISFKGEEKSGVLRVGNYGSFLDGVPCGAATTVKYRVFVRCVGCTTQRVDFHSKDGAQFTGQMTMGKLENKVRSSYTYEAWFRSPLEGDFRREIFGGATDGFLLKAAGSEADCTYSGTENEKTVYRVTAGGAEAQSSECFQKDLFYHVAVTKCKTKGVKVYVNGVDVTEQTGTSEKLKDSDISTSFGGGFQDGGQLFNVRIWNHARTADELRNNAFVTEKATLDKSGLEHWWPLTDNVMDVMTLSLLDGAEVRYSTVWCSDLEASGMRGC